MILDLLEIGPKTEETPEESGRGGGFGNFGTPALTEPLSNKFIPAG